MIAAMTDANIIMVTFDPKTYEPSGIASWNRGFDYHRMYCHTTDADCEEFVHTLTQRCHDIYASICDLLVNPFVLTNIIEECISIEKLNRHRHPICKMHTTTPCIRVDVSQLIQCMYIDTHGALHVDTREAADVFTNELKQADAKRPSQW